MKMCSIPENILNNPNFGDVDYENTLCTKKIMCFIIKEYYIVTVQVVMVTGSVKRVNELTKCSGSFLCRIFHVQFSH